MDVLAWDFKRPAWMLEAACRGMDSKDFFVDEETEERTEVELDGRLTCSFCPVQQECLAYAIENKIRHGVWGRMTSKQRDRIRYKKKHLKLVSS